MLISSKFASKRR